MVPEGFCTCFGVFWGVLGCFGVFSTGKMTQIEIWNGPELGSRWIILGKASRNVGNPFFSTTTSGCLGAFWWVIWAICGWFFAVFGHFWSFLVIFCLFAPPWTPQDSRKWPKMRHKGRKITKNRFFEKWSLMVFAHVLGHFGAFLGILGHFWGIFGRPETGKMTEIEI